MVISPEELYIRDKSYSSAVVTNRGEKWLVDEIVGERKVGRGHQYLVEWFGEGCLTWVLKHIAPQCWSLYSWVDNVYVQFFSQLSPKIELYGVRGLNTTKVV